MTRQQLINKLKALIIETANPERIWLYGSEASGDAKATSDIDIAFIAGPEYSGEEIKQLAADWPTLLSFDVTNLAHCDQRFIDRVKATGKSIYSNSKQLRAEDAIHSFGKALYRLKESVTYAAEHQEMRSDHEWEYIILDVQIKRFEFTYEMSWKAIKRVLAFVGMDASNPRACFKSAFTQGWIRDEHAFLVMMEMRNNTAYTYDLDMVKEITNDVPEYVEAFEGLYLELLKQVDGEDNL